MALKNTPALLSIIDANSNRAKEGLRVIEDFSRFSSRDKKLSAGLKSIRHGITLSVLKLVPDYSRLLASRDSAGDVGRRIKSRTESSAKKSDEILASNFKRAEESLRVLEEAAKIINAKISAEFKELRYRTYEAEKITLLKKK